MIGTKRNLKYVVMSGVMLLACGCDNVDRTRERALLHDALQRAEEKARGSYVVSKSNRGMENLKLIRDGIYAEAIKYGEMTAGRLAGMEAVQQTETRMKWQQRKIDDWILIETWKSLSSENQLRAREYKPDFVTAVEEARDRRDE